MTEEIRYAKCEICGDVWISVYGYMPPRNDRIILSFDKVDMPQEEIVALELAGKFRSTTCEACAVYKNNDGN